MGGTFRIQLLLILKITHRAFLEQALQAERNTESTESSSCSEIQDRVVLQDHKKNSYFSTKGDQLLVAFNDCFPTI